MRTRESQECQCGLAGVRSVRQGRAKGTCRKGRDMATAGISLKDQGGTPRKATVGGETILLYPSEFLLVGLKITRT